MDDIKYLDMNLLKGYINNLGVDIVQQMLDLYTQQSKLYLEEIESAIFEKSQQAWSKSCHKMKGASASVGLVATFSYLVTLEHSVEPWEEKSIFYKKLSRLNEDSIKAVYDYFNEKKASV